MTPFKIKVTIDQYENMGYQLKTGDTLYSKGRDGNYTVYCKLLNYDTKLNCWLAQGGSMKSFPATKVGHYIEIVVLPFEQYVRKLGDKAIRKQ